MQNLTGIEYILSQMPRTEVFQASDIPEFGTLRDSSLPVEEKHKSNICKSHSQGFGVFGISDVWLKGVQHGVDPYV